MTPVSFTFPSIYRGIPSSASYEFGLTALVLK
jgi:hypothetical protein